MSWTASLLPQLDHHFRWLSRAIEDVEVDRACFELAPGRPSIAWLVGHLTSGADSVAQAVAGLEAGLTEPFTARHGRPHWGVADARDWAQLRAEWSRVARRTARGLEQLPEHAFEQPPAIEILPAFTQRLATRHDFLAGEIFHFAYHLGQIGTLRAAQGLGWG